MNAEIISVGTELLLGQVVNLDTAIVAQELSALGIDLLYSAVVGDNVERLRHAVNTALSRSGLLIMTGGLGPTTDDLTKETTAACAGKNWHSTSPAWNAFRTTSMKSTSARTRRNRPGCLRAAMCSKTTTARPPAAPSRPRAGAWSSCCPALPAS